MNISLTQTENIHADVLLKISGSKSETNRLLILQAFYPDLSLKNASNSDDSVILRKAIDQLKKNKKTVIDVGHAGTAMRFLTAYCAIQEGLDVVLQGSERMNNRPIGALVEALQEMGATITYLNKEGFPPLHIQGSKINQNKVKISASQSSQFVTALLLIAPALPQGLQIELSDTITSESYLELSLNILQRLGIEVERNQNHIYVAPKSKLAPIPYTVESDWSSLSYYYSLLALLPNGKIRFKYYSAKSFQGDSVLKDIYLQFGVLTEFDSEQYQVTLTRVPTNYPDLIKLNLIRTPDIGQTIAVTCAGLGIPCVLEGLHTLKYKETDRLVALKTELEKLGVTSSVSDTTFTMQATNKLRADVAIATYQDHRMAMSFAPLAAKINLIVEDASVVSKSYPEFWNHFQALGVKCKFVSQKS